MLVLVRLRGGRGLSRHGHCTCQPQARVGDTVIAAFVKCPQQRHELRRRAGKGRAVDATAKEAGVQETQDEKTWALHFSDMRSRSAGA